MGMDETQMILALQALRGLLDKGDRDDWNELVASYRALGKAIVKNKPMTRKDRARVAEYLRARQDGGNARSAQPRHTRPRA
jgi:hypothetical protein